MSADGDRRSCDRLRRLFDFLISDGSDAAAAPGLLEDVGAMLALADHHKVSWAFAERLLDERGSELDEPALAATRDCLRAWAAWRPSHRQQLVELFSSVDVPMLHVKGFAAENWNGGRIVRDCADVDLTLPDLRTASAALDRLLELGYRLQDTCWLRRAPDGRLGGPIIAVAERPSGPEWAVEINVGGFPSSSFTPSLPLAVDEGVELRMDGAVVRIANRMQSLLVLCAETMHRELFVRDAMDLLLFIEEGGPETIVPPLLAAAREARLDWALGRLARFALSLLPARPGQAERRAWLRRVVARTRRPLGWLGAWPQVARSLTSAWGWRHGGRLTAWYAHRCVESWLFDRDVALATIQGVNRRRDPLAELVLSGAPVYTIPVHSGPTARLRRAPGLRAVREDPDGLWWGAVYESAPLLVLRSGVYLLSVDCVLEPADIARLQRELGRLAGA